MPLSVPSFAEFRSVYQRAVDRAPEAFSGDVLRNLVDGQWRDMGDPSTMVTPVDGTKTVALSKVGASDGDAAVEAAARAHRDWAATSLADRRARVGAAVDAMTDARDDLALLLGWEIGKPWRLACADVDRGLDGVRWYLDEIEGMLATDVDGAPFERSHCPGRSATSPAGTTRSASRCMPSSSSCSPGTRWWRRRRRRAARSPSRSRTR